MLRFTSGAETKVRAGSDGCDRRRNKMPRQCRSFRRKDPNFESPRHSESLITSPKTPRVGQVKVKAQLHFRSVFACGDGLPPSRSSSENSRLPCPQGPGYSSPRLSQLAQDFHGHIPLPEALPLPGCGRTGVAIGTSQVAQGLVALYASGLSLARSKADQRERSARLLAEVEGTQFTHQARDRIRRQPIGCS